VADRATARHYYEQALAINRDGGNKRGIGLCLSALGALAVADKHLPQAEAYLTEALAAYNAARLDRMLVDVWASLAQLRLAQNDEEGTHQHVQQVLDYVRDNPALPGSDNRMRVLHFTWRALVALDRQAEADALLAHAAHLIRQYLENISDSAIRERYLRQAHVRDVWSAWTASDDGGNVATL
jgi:tetratricopeptide (TPR) repeat protein